VGAGSGLGTKAKGIEAKVAGGLVTVINLLVGERLEGANDDDCFQWMKYASDYG
jgi:hypothetical protein